VTTDAKDALEDARAEKQKDDDKKIIVDSTATITPPSSPPKATASFSLDIFN
jgi:hypothetical protein